MFGNLGFPEILIIMVIVLLLFGAKRLPEIGRSLGSGMREFKDSVTGKNNEPDEPAQLPPAPATPEAAPPQAAVPPPEQEPASSRDA